MMWSLQIHGIGIVYLEDRRLADFCKFRDSLRRPVNSGPDWSTEEVPGKAGQLQIETLSQKEIKRKKILSHCGHLTVLERKNYI